MNFKDNDEVYVIFGLEVKYEEYQNSEHFALCREHNSTELSIDDLIGLVEIATKKLNIRKW